MHQLSSKGSRVSDNFNPPHMSESSSELSPQSSLPSHTHVWSLHNVLLQMNSSARQKKAPAITQIISKDFSVELRNCYRKFKVRANVTEQLCIALYIRHYIKDRSFHKMMQTALNHFPSHLQTLTLDLTFFSFHISCCHHIQNHFRHMCSQLTSQKKEKKEVGYKILMECSHVLYLSTA